MGSDFGGFICCGCALYAIESNLSTIFPKTFSLIKLLIKIASIRFYMTAIFSGK